MRTLTLLLLLATAGTAIAHAQEAKPLAFPDFSAVAPDTDDSDVVRDVSCVTSDGTVYRRGTEGFSQCMWPSEGKKINSETKPPSKLKTRRKHHERFNN